jgi:hypothetical protein
LNLAAPNRDQTGEHHAAGARFYFGGRFFMKTIRPDNTDPIPLRTTSPRMGTIMIRFVGLLVLAVVVMALAWSR